MESTENETIDQKPEADDEVDRLLRITAGAQFFRSIEGRFHARVPVNGRQEILGLRSAVFRDWLVGAYLKEQSEASFSADGWPRHFGLPGRIPSWSFTASRGRPRAPWPRLSSS